MKIILLCLLALTASSCSKLDIENDIEQLMTLHQEQKKAHLEKNARVLLAQSSDDFISVNHGIIDSIFNRQKQELKFQKYFDAVEFKKWDDVVPPKIFFSDDHTLAYMIVDKIVVLDTKDDSGNIVEETTHFAWVTIFRKQKSNDWKSECIISTNQPPSTTILIK